MRSVWLIHKFRGGISDDNKIGLSGAFKFGYGLDISSKKNVLTCDYALVKESSTVVVDLIRFIVPCSDGNAYGFGDTGKIYKRKGTTWTLEYTDSNGAISGAAEWNSYLYWACANGKISRIAVADADSSDWDSDVAHDWNTGLTAATWHTMKIASGALMICNDKFLALIDYSAAAFNAEALNLIPGCIGKSLEEVGQYVVIGTNSPANAEVGHIFTWETTALNYIKKNPVSTKGINALIVGEEIMAQGGVNGEVFSGVDGKTPLFRFPDTGYCLPDGVDRFGGRVIFGVSGNSSSKCGVYPYGRKNKQLPQVVHPPFVPSPGVITGIDIGSVKMVDGTLLVAWKSGDTYGVDALSTTTRANGVYESLEFDGKLPHIKKLWQESVVGMEPLPSGCSLALKFKLKNASSWTTAKTADGNSSFSTANATKATFLIKADGEVVELRAELTSNGGNSPKLRSIATYFDMPDGVGPDYYD